MNLVQKINRWLRQPPEPPRERTGTGGPSPASKPDGPDQRQLAALERRIAELAALERRFSELPAMERRIAELEGRLREQEANAKVKAASGSTHATEPPIVIQHLTVEKLLVDKLQYELNFGALGIRELQGTLNIGSNFGVGANTEKSFPFPDGASPSDKAGSAASNGPPPPVGGMPAKGKAPGNEEGPKCTIKPKNL